MANARPQLSAALGKIGRRSWTWLTGILIAAFAALLGGYATGLLGEVFPSPTELACRFQEWGAVDDAEPVSGPKFTILLSRLDRDTDGSQTRHIVYALERQATLEVIPTCRVLRIEPHGNRLSEARIESEKLGRQWLKKSGADLLIWGEVTKADQGLQLRFTSPEDRGTIDTSRYKLDDTLILPKSFHDDFAAQLVAVALSSVRPATEQAGTYLALVLRPVAAKLQQILNSSDPGLTAFQKADLHHAFGLAATTVGEQTGDKVWLEQAVAAFQTALQERTRERVPLDWAKTQSGLGGALGTLGARESDPARLEQAVAAYRAVLQERTRERVPLD